MRLIDILVQELPKRGGWPDGHISARQDGDMEICFTGGLGVPHDFYVGCMAGDVTLSDGTGELTPVTREQYEAALAASKVPVWDGEGVPPIGVKFEMSFAGDAWFECEIIAKGKEQIIYQQTGCREFSGHQNNYRFRPIRTEADRKREAAIKSMREALGHAGGLTDVTSIYRAISEGKIPGIKLED